MSNPHPTPRNPSLVEPHRDPRQYPRSGTALLDQTAQPRGEMTSSVHQPVNLILHGPHANAGGGVLAFCNTLEQALRQHEPIELKRWFIGAATGDGTTTSGAVAGIKALVSSLPSLLAMTQPGRVLHINTSFTQKALVRDAIFARIARARGAHLVVQFHGGLPEHTADRASRWAIQTLATAEALVVINEGQRQQLKQLHPNIAGRIERIANSVELPALNLSERTLARLTHPRLLFLSRLDSRKGILETIEALGMLRDAGLNLHLDVAGDGPALADAKAMTQRLGLETAITFHGTVGGEAKARLFREASLFMFPSYYPEGQPIAVLEAFAWGLPVVATNLEPVASLVPDGENGLHVPPRDAPAIAKATQQLLANRTVYSGIAQANRARAEREFDANVAVKRFLQVYQRATTTAEDNGRR